MHGAAWLLLLLVLAMPAQATEQTASELDQLQDRLGAARNEQQTLAQEEQALAGELGDLRRRLITATTAADENDAKLQELEGNLGDLEATASRRSAALAVQREELSRTLALLQRLAMTPAAAQLVSPTPPLDRLRADMQLRVLVPEIQARSAEVASTIRDLNLLRRTLEQQRQNVLRERNRALQQSRELDALIAERDQKLVATRQRASVARQRAVDLAGKAQNLRELIDRLEAEPANAAVAPTLALPAGAARRLPVSAPLLVKFGQKDSYGSVSKGITLRPRPNARVAAIAPGRIAFSEPFRGYGRVLIVSHPGGYHSVLAGLAQLSVDVGDQVAAGEPLGQMSETREPAPELYFEVRFEGTPIDPLGAKAQALTQQR
jgi:septal ring factor EnvC (AmiA/AmiB activator)